VINARDDADSCRVDEVVRRTLGVLLDDGGLVRRVMLGATTSERDDDLRDASVLDAEELLLVILGELLLRLITGEEERLTVRLELEEGR
jgi:hypothetical protein